MKKTKKLISLFVAVLMIFSSMPLSSNLGDLFTVEASAADVVEGTCGENLTWKYDNSGTLTISGTGAMEYYNPLYLVPWYDYRAEIKEIIIEPGITSISAYAFYDMDLVTSVVVPSGVETLENGAFCGCGITSITLPTSLTTISDKAFHSCDSLTDVYYLGTSEEWDNIEIGDSNSNLLNANIDFAISHSGTCGDNLTWKFNKNTGILTISGYGYMDDYSVTNNAPWYEIREQIKELVYEGGDNIGEYAFSDCTSLSRVNVYNMSFEIGKNAFNNCTSLCELYFPYEYLFWEASVYVYDSDFLDNLDHFYTEENELSATCATIGYEEGIYCNICNEYVSGGDIILATGNHRGGEATCVSLATCTVCKNSYGELNPDNHKNTELRNITEPTCTTEGCAGDTYCVDCNTKIADGAVIPVVEENHILTYNSNGLFSGKHTVICTECGLEETESCIYASECNQYCSLCGGYSRYVPDEEHSWVYTRVNPTDTWHEMYCENCNLYVYSVCKYEFACSESCEYCGGENPDVVPHSGGEATCTEAAICDFHGNSYGEINPDNHINTEIRNAVESTNCYTYGYTGDTYCADCGILLQEGETTDCADIHDYVNGQCQHCDSFNAVMYFDNSGINWSNVYAYLWSDYDISSFEWPGVATENIEDTDLYAIYQNSNSAVSDELLTYIIFNNTNRTQTADLNFVCCGIYSGAFNEIIGYRHSYVDGKCEYCGEEEPIIRNTVSGIIKTFDDGVENSDVITISLYKSGEDTAAYTTTVSGSGEIEYLIDGVESGTYTVNVSKINHVTREYTITVENENITQDMKLHLLGDINGDGTVRMSDMNLINSHIKETVNLDGYELLCADVNGDGSIRMNDMNLINAHIKETKLLW